MGCETKQDSDAVTQAKRAEVVAAVKDAEEKQRIAASEQVLECNADLDQRLSSVQVEPTPEEPEDSNMPKNLHNAAELFLKSGNLEAARTLQRCAQKFFTLFELGPNAVKTKLGRGCICWSCGHCGIEQDLRKCPVSCSSDAQVNYVQVRASGGAVVPWIEENSCAPEATKPSQVRTSEVEDDDSIEGFDKRLMSFRIEPNSGEDAHPNFPRNLFNAAELLLHQGMIAPTKRLQLCTNQYLQYLEAGPQEGDVMGRARVCFSCGHCSLAEEKEAGAEGAVDVPSDKAGVCSHCEDGSHTNYVQLVLPNGQSMPWIQRGVIKSSAGQTGTNVSQKASGKVKPNEQCPCGSGKKAKKCCHVGGS